MIVSRNVRRFKNYSKFSTQTIRENLVDYISKTFNSKSFDSEEEEVLKNSTLENSINLQTEKQEILSALEQCYFDSAKEILNPVNNHYKLLLQNVKELPALSQNIQEDILTWVDQTNKELKKSNPFEAQNKYCQKLKKIEAQENQLTNQELENLILNYKKLKNKNDFNSQVNFDFYLNAIKEPLADELPEIQQQYNPEGIAKREVLVNFCKDVSAEVVKKITDWEIIQIQKLRQKFIKKLFDKIEKFLTLKQIISNFSNDFGVLWDLSEGEFRNCGFELLDKYSELLKNDQGLKQLAEMIGHHQQEEIKYHKELRDKIVVESFYNPEPAYKGEISGLTLSDDISSSLPSELSLYVNKKTRQIFKMKFAQKQILSYAYTKNVEYKKSRTEQEEVNVAEKIEHKGPMIICVDTSGSMAGGPERVAKTIAFSLAKKSIEEKRNCFLISFSTGIKVMDLTTFNSINGLIALTDFLQMGFYGGTDVNPALEYSLEMLKKENYKNADVLVISDFIMGKLGGQLEKQILKEKENKTRFFSLAVCQDFAKNNPIKIFDSSWVYDIYSENGTEKLVKQLAEMENLPKN